VVLKVAGITTKQKQLRHGIGGLTMKGLCKISTCGIFSCDGRNATVIIGINSCEKWRFEDTSDGRVNLRNRNMSIFIPRHEFEKKWTVIKEEG
jgi:hypothetical protein